ncbi:AsmA-like C-terminal region-containing protein [Oharaeibacter diazotrophicus]|uniref:AsmA-like protein n=1 Tax=Oharaeibacter diazotrophicus TaxID=1920512 RepID=A0A4R6RKN3_9HYPH|nr:AsmA-like C-terminal region-containing protein [Oharaeibacter diazotrophicus]TDP86665.1 AsmA-like protein [Oharaeibacter diazotrophicus]BBE71393.1 hypothetical protein OHA_1_00967 [Pleomorphomonas sp. SM30]GLS78151.1 hypothetical protein GCM10007904_34880 [Oharaeibacter diazotrophicus]
MDSEHDDLATAATPVSPRPRRRGRRLAWTVVALLALLVVGAGVLVARLLSGPIWTSVGTGRVSAEVAARLGPGATAAVGVVGLSLDETFAPVVHLRDIHVGVPESGTVSIDTLEIATVWGALTGGEIRLTSIEADHVLADVTGGGGGPPPSVPGILAALDGVLQQTGVAHAEIDSLTLRRPGADGAPDTILDAVAVDADAADESAVTATLAGGGARGSWAITASIGPGDDRVARRMTLRTRGLDIADVQGMAGDDAPAFGGPVSLTGTVGIAADGAVLEARGEVVFGPVEPADGGEALLPNQSRVGITYDADTGTIEVAPSTVRLETAHALVGGTVRPPTAADRRWTFRLAARASEDDGTSADAVTAGSYDPGQHLLSIDEFSVTGEGTRFAAAMRLSQSAGGLAGAVSGAFAEMPVATLKSIWPPMVAKDARRWVVENVVAGTISDAAVDVTVTADALSATARTDARATLDFRFSGLAFRSFDDGPFIRDAVGTGRYADDRFEIALASGVVDLENGRTMAIGPATFTVPLVSKDPPDGAVRVHLEGDGPATLALWKRLPLGDGAALDLAPEDVAGRAVADVDLTLPLVRDLRADQVTYQGRIALSDVDLAKPIEGRALRDGQLTVDVGGGVARIHGKAMVDGVSADIDLSEPLDAGKPGSSVVRMTLDAAARRKLGLPFPEMVSGVVDVAVETVPSDGGARRRKISVDLAKAAVDLPAVGFAKPKGKPGTLVFTLVEARGGTEIDDLAFRAGPAAVEGSILLDGDGEVQRGVLSTLRFAAGDDLSMKLSRRDGRLVATVAGRSLDGRALIRRQLKAGDDAGGDEGSGGGPDLDLDVSIDAVTGFGDERLSGVNLSARLAGGSVRALSVTAQTAGGGATSATLTPFEAGRRISVEVGEVGRVLRFLDVYGRVFGGRATVTGSIDDAGVLRASLDGSRWRIVEEPALARLSTAAQDGPTEGLSTADIGRLLADITFADGRLGIEDGVVRAASAGLSLQGDVDFRRDVLSLGGTYLPASSLDSLIGKIPLLGQTVFAGGRAGLLGVSFRLTGPLDDPKLGVNPLSVIAPGIFRKLFELR